MAKQLIFNEEAREYFKKGVDTKCRPAEVFYDTLEHP